MDCDQLLAIVRLSAATVVENDDMWLCGLIRGLNANTKKGCINASKSFLIESGSKMISYEHFGHKALPVINIAVYVRIHKVNTKNQTISCG